MEGYKGDLLNSIAPPFEDSVQIRNIDNASTILLQYMAKADFIIT